VIAVQDKKFCVYIHENKINGKVYIGITSQRPENRWRTNGEGYFTGYKYKTPFQYAIEKYGWDNFNHVIVIKNISEERAKFIEQKLIVLFSANDRVHGYNLTAGGDGISCYECSDKLRKARSERMKNRYISDETRKRMSEAKKDIIPWNKGRNVGFTDKQLKARRDRARKVKSVDGIFDTITDCANYYGIGRKTVQDWLSGKRKPSKKYADLCISFLD
jgi:group I intron endonuclease